MSSSRGILHRLPDHKFDTLILTFAQETDISASDNGGYVLYEGDAIISLFPVENDKC
ncbi:MAG: hypothetical protein M3264_05630 [Thermoproteota archaeon]|nr:hypothetical protein [Thermoproteota archaeon]